MADLRYTVDVDTRGAERSVSSLKNTILAAGSAIAGAFAVREIGQFVASTVDAARSVQDLGITLEVLYGDAQLAAEALDAVEKSAAKLPISLQQIQAGVPSLALVEDQFGSLERAIEFTAGVASSFGMSFQEAAVNVQRALSAGIGAADLFRDRGVKAFLGFQEGAEYTAEETRDKFLESFDEIVAGNEKAAKSLTGQFSMVSDAAFQFKREVGEAFGETLQVVLADALDLFAANREEILAIARAIGTTLATGLKVVVENLRLIATLMAAAFGAAVTRGVIALVTQVVRLGTALRTAGTVAAALAGATALFTPAGWVALAGGVAAGAAAWFGLGSAIDDAKEKTKEFQESVDPVNEALADTQDLTNLTREQMEAMGMSAEEIESILKKTADTTKDIKTATSQTADELKRQLETIDKMSGSYKDQNDNLLASLQYAKERLELEKEMIDASDEERAVREALLEFEQDHKEALREVNQELQEAINKYGENSEQANALRSEITEINALYKAQLSDVEKITAEVEAQRAANAEIVRLAEATADATKEIADFQADLTEGTKDAQREFDRLNMNTLEKELDDISYKLTRDMQDKIKDIQDLKLTPQVEKEKIEEITRATEDAIKAQQQVAREAYEHQRTFEYGWKRAYEQYAEDATNAAKTAEDFFKTATQGMEDALVGFIQTGKFEWKSFVNELVELLLRSELKRLIADIFGGIGAGGSGGGSGGGKSILGTIGSAIGSIFGGGGGSGGGSGGGIIGSIVGGVKKIFGGLFADGGYLGAGKFGIAGENGPELITGPANITPMSMGGQQNVTYNINAVDAASFRSMIAREPELIHAVAMKGGSSIPRRR